VFADFAFAREHVTPEPPSPVKVYTRGGATADTRHQASNHQCIMRTPIAMAHAHGPWPCHASPHSALPELRRAAHLRCRTAVSPTHPSSHLVPRCAFKTDAMGRPLHANLPTSRYSNLDEVPLRTLQSPVSSGPLSSALQLELELPSGFCGSPTHKCLLCAFCGRTPLALPSADSHTTPIPPTPPLALPSARVFAAGACM